MKSTQKEKFFISDDSTFQPFNAANKSLNVLIDKSIVETIIVRLLLDADNNEDVLNSENVAISMFQDEENEDVDANSEIYMISNVLQFKLIVKYIAAGQAFRECCAVFQEMKSTTNLGQIGACN
jgi:hypothetical protein